eukprot:241548-Rhodomonas_salina.4
MKAAVEERLKALDADVKGPAARRRLGLCGPVCSRYHPRACCALRGADAAIAATEAQAMRSAAMEWSRDREELVAETLGPGPWTLDPKLLCLHTAVRGADAAAGGIAAGSCGAVRAGGARSQRGEGGGGGALPRRARARDQQRQRGGAGVGGGGEAGAHAGGDSRGGAGAAARSIGAREGGGARAAPPPRCSPLPHVSGMLPSSAS